MCLFSWEMKEPYIRNSQDSNMFLLESPSFLKGDLATVSVAVKLLAGHLLCDLWAVPFSLFQDGKWTPAFRENSYFICLFFASKNHFIFCFFFSFIFISWRLITLQYCSGFCHTLTWISHGFTCVPHPNPPSHLPTDPIPLGLPSAPALSTCFMHPTWAGDLFHRW